MKCKKVIHILSTSYPHKNDNLYTHLSTRLLLNFSEKTDLSTLSTLLLLLLRNNYIYIYIITFSKCQNVNTNKYICFT